MQYNVSDNKIKAKTFIMDLSEDDFNGNDLGNFTFIGKRILKRLLREVSQYLILLKLMLTHFNQCYLHVLMNG